MFNSFLNSQLARSPKKRKHCEGVDSVRVRNTAEHDSSVSSGVAVRMQQTGSH